MIVPVLVKRIVVEVTFVHPRGYEAALRPLWYDLTAFAAASVQLPCMVSAHLGLYDDEVLHACSGGARPNAAL